MTANITDLEYQTFIAPVAEENWHDAHSIKLGERDLTDAEYDEIDKWAVLLRESYETGKTPIYWSREGYTK